MAVSFSCHCAERRKPIEQRRWVVIARKCNHSAFNGYHCTSSRYSEVYCIGCGAIGRTKAAFVNKLKDGKLEEAMRARGEFEHGGVALVNDDPFDMEDPT